MPTRKKFAICDCKVHKKSADLVHTSTHLKHYTAENSKALRVGNYYGRRRGRRVFGLLMITHYFKRSYRGTMVAERY